jgi:hypothetical protein
LTKTRPIWIKILLSAIVMNIMALVAYPPMMISVLSGSLIALANFWLLERLVGGLIGRADGRAVNMGKMLLTFVAKLAIILGVLALVMMQTPIEIIPFLIGLSCVFVGIVFEGVTGLFRKA